MPPEYTKLIEYTEYTKQQIQQNFKYADRFKKK